LIVFNIAIMIVYNVFVLFIFYNQIKDSFISILPD
jgi:hypothetical protein